MMPFRRATPPEFWAEVEQEWRARVDAAGEEMSKLPDPLYWIRDGSTIARHFLIGVRASGGPQLCAYCDGSLGETSPETIDHFVPRAEIPTLALCWRNLFPACTKCNSSHKRDQWSCRLLRPDVDFTGGDDFEAFSKMFWFEPDSGRLLPAPGLDRLIFLRVKLTLRVLGLNTEGRRRARRRAWQLARSADDDTLMDLARNGPYRFVVRELLRARGH